MRKALGRWLPVGSVSIALDAAPIRWHQAGGPPLEANGIALCVLHHRTIDLRDFTVTAGGALLGSDQAHGTGGFHEALLRHHGGRIRPPSGGSGCPRRGTSPGTREVFRGAARPTA